MRSFIAISALACLGIAGCTSNAGLDDFVPRPSNEVTSSISRPEAALPKAEVADAVADEPDVQQPVADAMPQDKPDLPAETVAYVAPAKPSAAPMTIYERRFRDAKPINFGKSSPKRLAVHGVDVSWWQGKIDWDKLRGQGANFVYMKATDGGDHLDPMFKKNWRAAKEAG